MPTGLLAFLNSGLDAELAVKAAFYAVAGLTVLFALMVVLARNLFHSALYLAIVLTGIACVYLYLDAEFLAIVQILIYVGAVVTLFIFAIMFTADLHKKIVDKLSFRAVASLAAVSALFAILVKKVFTAGSWKAGSTAEAPFELAELGKSLMTRYALPFEVLSVLLLAVLVGAVVIGKTEKK